MSLKDQITEDMKTAMRAKDSGRLGTIRLLQAAMKQKEVDERVTLDDAMVIAIVDKLIKQRKDSIDAFNKAGSHRGRAGCQRAGRHGQGDGRRQAAAGRQGGHGCGQRGGQGGAGGLIKSHAINIKLIAARACWTSASGVFD